jgi:PTH1 family peptidyl-tRNA hydrolase
MDTPYLIVGLGNPGRGYEDTRHNTGFEVVSLLADRWGMQFAAGKGDYVVARGRFGDIPVILAKPTTFMNQSGFAVQALISFFKVEIEHLLIVVDDVNIPLGKIRFRSEGSGGGQKGLENVIYQLGRDDFTRLRIGIGAENLPEDLTGYVLGAFREEEIPIIEETIVTSADAVEVFLKDGIEEAMNRFN